jgi:hypothetical protein
VSRHHQFSYLGCPHSSRCWSQLAPFSTLSSSFLLLYFICLARGAILGHLASLGHSLLLSSSLSSLTHKHVAGSTILDHLSFTLFSSLSHSPALFFTLFTLFAHPQVRRWPGDVRSSRRRGGAYHRSPAQVVGRPSSLRLHRTNSAGCLHSSHCVCIRRPRCCLPATVVVAQSRRVRTHVRLRSVCYVSLTYLNNLSITHDPQVPLMGIARISSDHTLPLAHANSSNAHDPQVRGVCTRANG